MKWPWLSNKIGITTS